MRKQSDFHARANGNVGVQPENEYERSEFARCAQRDEKAGAFDRLRPNGMDLVIGGTGMVLVNLPKSG